MARSSSNKIYLEKVFHNARRCLKEARQAMHPSASKVIKLTNPYSNRREEEEVMDIEYAVRWCVSFHVPNWSQSTWRMMRSAYNMMLLALENRKKISPTTRAELSELMANTKGMSRKERGANKKTSARRKKVVTPNDIKKIEDYLKLRKHRWGRPLVTWLWAAVGSGLRPNEWQTAKLEERSDGRLVLISENFKYSETRSYGPLREIDIADIPTPIQLHIKAHLKNVEEAQGGFIHFYKGCSALLLLLNKKLWPRRKANINLYTGRHQFSANAKADPDVSDVERAAMMGHKTTKTSSERYGLGRSGNKGLTPKVADPSVLDNIKEVVIRKSPQQSPNAIKVTKG
ncbi:hypothetical protein [Alteromonas sp. 14N.309.X.WAT.G.H12]|uniref:hypothetical protein n=1 Tax=Alteromonas sp. 14N.309.X.WAT.G.H12 TaxID=3120824 RepID=UPI002FCF2856